MTEDGRIQALIESLLIERVPITPFVETISLPTKNGDKLTVDLPAAYLLLWITTFIVSIGWITAEATLPERDPTKNGLAYPQKTLYPSDIKDNYTN